MSRLILHIGTHKTATTAVQEGFASHRDALAAAGLIYPRLGPEDYAFTGHHGLVSDWNPNLERFALPGGSRAALRKLAADYGKAPGLVLLSSQEFSRGRPGGQVDFRALRADLAGFERIEVICTLRDQWQFLQSVWIEMARNRPPPAPHRVVKITREGGLTAGLWADYSALYTHLRQAFAPDEISFLDYRKAARSPGGVPGALLAHLGLGGESARFAGRKINVSPPPLASWAAAHVAGAETATPALIQAASAALRVQFGLGRSSSLWSRGDLALLRAYGAEANARLSEALARDGRPGFALSPAPLAEDAVHPEDLTTGFWLRLARRHFAALPQQA